MTTTRIVICVTAALAMLLGSQTASAQGLGEVAKREQARRKDAPKTTGKRYTNDSLTRDFTPTPAVPAGSAPSGDSPAAVDPQPGQPTPAPAPSTESASAAPSGQSATSGAPNTDDPKAEAYWRGRIGAARAALEHSQTFVEAMQSRINGLTTDFVNRDDPAQRAVIEQNRLKAIAELERAQREIVQQTKAVADIEDEARRAGVPAGWLR